jgi:hypothetical protein
MNIVSTQTWNPEQLAVIEANGEQRLLVDGGPGTGKTAVLSARIANLIDNFNISPSNILVISFTRTAVAELRNRLNTYLVNKQDAFGIKVATIDSHAWSLNSGFDAAASMSGSFDNNINNVIELVKRHEGVFEYLKSMSHVFIDESQDVVANRLELMLEIINVIPKDAGVTIFSDEAQSIYGFSEKLNENYIKGTLPSNIEKYFENFKKIELLQIHRTSKQNLCEIYINARKLLKSDNKPKDILSNVRKLIRANRDDKAPPIDDLPSFIKGLEGETFILFRTRGEALHAANVFFSQNEPCRLRLSGLPNVIQPWVASIFSDCISPTLSKDDFQKKWKETFLEKSALTVDQSWNLLVHHFGLSHEKIDIHYMRNRLSSISPPIEFCLAEFGGKGPVIGTIHTSKGRESDNVIFYFPKIQAYIINKSDECMEEARTVFVGATRTKSQLFIGDAEFTTGRTHMKSGRAYREVGLRLTSVNVEVGRTRDINADDLTGLDVFETALDAKKNQTELAQINESKEYRQVSASRFKNENKFFVHLKNSNELLFTISSDFTYDLKNIVRELRVKTHGWELSGLQIVGTRTLVLRDQDPRVQKLHQPWSNSGVMMAPLLIGFADVSLMNK